MIYNSFANYTTKALHLGIDYTFPSHPVIAAISGGVGWYAYRFGMTYTQGYLVNSIRAQIINTLPTALSTLGSSLGTAAAPLIVPWVSPYLSTQISLTAALATSLTLNLIAQRFFDIPIKRSLEKKRTLQDIMDEMGLQMPKVPKEEPANHPEPFVTPEATFLPQKPEEILKQNDFSQTKPAPNCAIQKEPDQEEMPDRSADISKPTQRKKEASNPKKLSTHTCEEDIDFFNDGSKKPWWTFFSCDW